MKTKVYILLSVLCMCMAVINPVCPETEICDNGVDDDGDAHVDCKDLEDCDCAEICDNGIDDDFDGLADCRDDECIDVCPENCGNQIDDDFDGSTDCEDRDCWADGGEKKFSISEIMYDPLDNEVSQEWVELCNEGTKCADGSGFTIADGSSITPTVFQEGVVFRAGQCKIVSNNSVNTFDCHVQTHVQWTIEITLNNEGDSVTLKDAEGNILDKMVYSLGMASPGKSLEKCRDESGKTFYRETTADVYGCENAGSPELPNTCD